MNKIKIELNSDEYINLLNLVQGEAKELPEPNAFSSIAKRLIESLNNARKENEIQTQVKSAIVRLAGGSVEQISNIQKLTKDLHLETLQIRSLATSFRACVKIVVRNLFRTWKLLKYCQFITSEINLALQFEYSHNLFTAIAKKYKLEASINSDECEKLVTVQDCIDLIMEKTK